MPRTSRQKLQPQQQAQAQAQAQAQTLTQSQSQSQATSSNIRSTKVIRHTISSGACSSIQPSRQITPVSSCITTEQVITYLGGLSGKKITKKDLDQICKMLRSITSLQKLTVDNKIKLIERINVFLKEAELDAGSLVTIFNLIVKSSLFNTANYPYKQRHSDVSKQLIYLRH